MMMIEPDGGDTPFLTRIGGVQKSDPSVGGTFSGVKDSEDKKLLAGFAYLGPLSIERMVW